MSKKGIISGEVDVMHGSMVINEGQIESVSGSLVGQDHLAQIFQRLLQSGCGEEVLTTGERFKTVTIAFPQHYYTISRRGPKIYVDRLAHNSASAEMFVNSQTNTVAEDAQNAVGKSGARVAQNQQIDAADEHDRTTSSNFVEERAAESDNESTTTSSSIATVKSDQEKDSDDEDIRNEPVEKEGPFNIHLPTTIDQEPHSIESSIQQSKKN